MKECECTFAQRTVGDGCEACNPGKALEYAEGAIEDFKQENARLREALEELLSSFLVSGSQAKVVLKAKAALEE
jgi:hypothetical protein